MFGVKLQNWAQLSHFNPSHKTYIQHQSLWYNNYIEVNNRPVFIKSWHRANVNKLKDLLNVNDDLMYYDDFNLKCNFNVNLLQFYSVPHAIPASRKQKIQAPARLNDSPVKTNIVQSFLQSKRPTLFAYKVLITQLVENTPHIMYKWSEELNTN